MNYQQNATEILTRLKSALKLRSDADLARVMNINPSTVGAWKVRQTLDHEKIISICNERALDLHLIFYGKPLIADKPLQNAIDSEPKKPGNDILVQSLLKNIALLEDRIARSEETLKRASEMERQLMETQSELLKIQAELLDHQKKLREALATIADLKKRKAA